MGLDRIKAAFRYCVGCGLFVGRACCWNSDALACVIDTRLELTTALVVGATPDSSANDSNARRRLSEMAASLEALEHLHDLAGLAPNADNDYASSRQAWDEAWWNTGWLIVRAETSRDAAAKALFRSSVPPGSPAVPNLDSQLRSLEEHYERARAVIEARLATAGDSLVPQHSWRVSFPVPSLRLRWPAPIMFPRGVPTGVGAGALGVIAALVFGAAVLSQLGYLNPFANRNIVAGDPEGAVLGGGGGPVQSTAPPSSPTATPVPFEPQAVVARLDFDEVRIGPLGGTTAGISSVVGHAEVVPFPSSFDRSIRAGGIGPHRFCMPVSTLDDGGIAFAMDVYAEDPIDSGRLVLSMAPPAAATTAASVPLELLDDLPLEAWHHLSAVWTPSQPVAIAMGDVADGNMRTLTLPTTGDAPAVAGAVCIEVSGMHADAVLLLDNLEVKQ